MTSKTLALDGPAGSGKSSVSRAVAQSLGWVMLDTGAMYRAVTWAVLEARIDLTDPVAISLEAANTTNSHNNRSKEFQYLGKWP